MNYKKELKCMSENKYYELPLNLLRITDLLPAINYLNTIAQSISSAYQSLNLDELTEIYKTYTKFGWTIPPAMTCFAKQKATTLEEADSFMLQFCSSENMERIFSDLRNNDKIDTNDLEEAINCYNQKYYKACSLLILSMIDGILIKLQPQEKKNKKVNFALTEIESICEKNQTKNYKLFITLQAITTVDCAKKIYENAKNFTADDINRNMISHGMRKTAVEKTYCVKVILLLYNILQLLHYQKITEL